MGNSHLKYSNLSTPGRCQYTPGIVHRMKCKTSDCVFLCVDRLGISLVQLTATKIPHLNGPYDNKHFLKTRVAEKILIISF